MAIPALWVSIGRAADTPELLRGDDRLAGQCGDRGGRGEACGYAPRCAPAAARCTHGRRELSRRHGKLCTAGPAVPDFASNALLFGGANSWSPSWNSGWGSWPGRAWLVAAVLAVTGDAANLGELRRLRADRHPQQRGGRGRLTPPRPPGQGTGHEGRQVAHVEWSADRGRGAFLSWGLSPKSSTTSS